MEIGFLRSLFVVFIKPYFEYNEKDYEKAMKNHQKTINIT